ncbi:MAG: hybrid sensor histidine kinase/response regulator [Thermoleophilia bacterium]
MNNWTDDTGFMETFRAEAAERLQVLSNGLMHLEESPGDEEMLKKLFREAHTLKGAAGMMGLDAIKELSHRMEDILEAVQKGRVTLRGGTADLLLETLDRIETLLPEGQSEPEPVSAVAELLRRLEAVRGSDEASQVSRADVPPAVGEAGAEPATANAEPESGTALKVVEPEASGVLLSPEPVMENRTAPPAAGGAADSQQDGQPSPQKNSRNESTIRVNIDRLDNLLNLMGEILVNQGDAEEKIGGLSQMQNRLREMKSLFAGLRDQVRRLKGEVEAERMDVIDQQIIRMEDTLARTVDEMGSVTKGIRENTNSRRLALDDLQDQALHVRMLPIASIFSLYPRVARSAAASTNKKVLLKVSGEKTELDKRILEQVADPLMHIVRNCVDHGIESPAEREAVGKPQQGTIWLKASQRGDRVEITVEDDGGGINPDKIRAAAAAKGIIAESDSLSDEEAVQLIFKTGFSTADAVTALSGRGVGLDVVRNNIEKLEGSVGVESEIGTGTKFKVSLPVTLAVINGLLVGSDESRFIIPMASVKELVSLAPDDIQSLGTHKGFLMRGSAVPLIDLKEFLGGNATEAESRKLRVVIVGAERDRLGLIVGNLAGERETVIKSLGEFLPHLRFIAGVTVLGSGEPVLVLNINELVCAVKEGTSFRDASRPVVEAAAGPADRKAVLVVEDSLVVREMQRNILEAAGYQVDTAVDGNDALSQLSVKPVDCVVTDIEMPGMDGFHLTSAIRRNKEISDIPVIMVSSRSSDDDKRKGAEAGANAYVVKGSFDQQNLLDTICRLVA